ncbi:EscU/YscU/HrcU family type III secretion system export apparatus switch protein [Proteiniborus ethanoligenes]|uniref:EscU/YscU/HrcU family type III secretion system export apparatus switch protein n=1 Tax=Proteiniborus ethanoligenes TaxID=415015 RepID=UPI001AD8D662|nr:EscU/YscU/HrcU family type III secretion system export apparatus switch protein [Proteiniborus ethanoligenes]
MDKKKDKKMAVALQYDSDIKDAPFVVAKGKGIIADNIIEEGIKEGIKIIEDKNLVHSLINLEITQEIPEELYAAVAQIISFIYGLDNEREKYYE